MHLGVLLDSALGSHSSARVGSCTCDFLPRGCSSVTLPFARNKGSVAFPRGFPTGLSHVPPWCESILSVKVEAVQGKQLPLEWTETSEVSWNGDTTLEFLSPFLWRVPPLEMRREHRDSFPTTEGKIPPLELGGGNGAPLDVGGTLVLPLEWRRVCRGTS